MFLNDLQWKIKIVLPILKKCYIWYSGPLRKDFLLPALSPSVAVTLCYLFMCLIYFCNCWKLDTLDNILWSFWILTQTLSVGFVVTVCLSVCQGIGWTSSVKFIFLIVCSLWCQSSWGTTLAILLITLQWHWFYQGFCLSSLSALT